MKKKHGETLDLTSKLGIFNESLFVACRADAQPLFEESASAPPVESSLTENDQFLSEHLTTETKKNILGMMNFTWEMIEILVCHLLILIRGFSMSNITV